MTVDEQILARLAEIQTLVGLVAYVAAFFFGMWLYYRFRAKSRWFR
jgi:hypothetical protein